MAKFCFFIAGVEAVKNCQQMGIFFDQGHLSPDDLSISTPMVKVDGETPLLKGGLASKGP